MEITRKVKNNPKRFLGDPVSETPIRCGGTSWVVAGSSQWQ